MKSTVFYPLCDGLSSEERKFFGIRLNDVWARDIYGIQSGERRCPKKGEWYLSGAIPAAYKAPNDLSTVFHIAKLVKTETITYKKILKFANDPE